MNNSLRVAELVMPEKGHFFARVIGCEVDIPCGRWVAALDYGIDVGKVILVRNYDASVHGVRPPAFRLERPFAEMDVEVEKKNAKRAEEMCKVFVDGVVNLGIDIRMVHYRLSFGGNRFFLRFSTVKSDNVVEAVALTVANKFAVEVNARRLGPREEVAFLGAIGDCGRVCCCHEWGCRANAAFRPEGIVSAAMNGVCGRFRCCLDFEKGK